jgi:MinD superfamily P-loop ATPase
MRSKFDWVICDSPAGIERGATLAMRFADAAVVVTNPEVSSVRDSDRIIGLLDSKTEKAERGEHMEKHILITRYDAQRAQRGEMLNIEDVLEILSIPLLGIIPESQEVCFEPSSSTAWRMPSSSCKRRTRPAISPTPNGWRCCSIARRQAARPDACKPGCVQPGCVTARPRSRMYLPVFAHFAPT